MATVSERKTRSGIAYTARIRRRRKGQGYVSEAKSFPTEIEAQAWATAREREIGALPDFAAAIRTSPRRNPTVSDTIARYVDLKNDLSDSKLAVLGRVRRFAIAEIRVADLDAGAIVEFAREKARDEVAPATITRYLAELSAVLEFARVYWGAAIDGQAMRDGWRMAAKLGIAGKSPGRSRRPTLRELDRLMEFFRDRRIGRPTAIPMERIVAFAIFSTRRRGEICRIRWADLDRNSRQVLVRNMKHPGERIGNNVNCDLPDPALAIAASMPRKSGRIFPFAPESVSAIWAEACRKAHVRDLHFHDLRHEGVSRLFELGWNVPRVMAVSGHRSMSSLQRYTHFREITDKFAGWPWIDRVVEPEWAKVARSGESKGGGPSR